MTSQLISAQSSTFSNVQSLNKAFSNVDHQVEFLHLQAEAEALLTQLRVIQQQRQATTTKTLVQAGSAQ